MRQQLDHLAVADPEAALRMQSHLDSCRAAITASRMDELVTTVIDALCVEVSYGRTLADGLGRMVTTAPPEKLDRYLSLVKTAAVRGPTLAGILAKHLVSVLTCEDVSVADKFEKTVGIMLQKGTYTLKAPLEAVTRFIEAQDLGSAQAFLDLLAATYCQDLSYNRCLYLTHTLPRAATGFSKPRRCFQIRQLIRVMEIDVRLTDAYLQGLDAGLDLLTEKSLHAFVDQAVRLYRGDNASGCGFLSLASRQARETCWNCQVAVPLSAVRSGLERYLRARTGLAVPVRPLAALPSGPMEEGTGVPLVHCDGKAVYLPDEIDVMERREDNVALYKLLIRMEAGAFEYGTYAFDVEKASHLSGVERTPATPGAKANESDLARFTRRFDHPSLALDLFTVFEHARIVEHLERDYPGLSRRIGAALADRTLQQRAGQSVGGTCYPFYRHLVMKQRPGKDRFTERLARDMARQLHREMAAAGKDSVQTSALLATSFYPLIAAPIAADRDAAYRPLDLPFGRRWDPGTFGSFHEAQHRLATKLQRLLAEKRVFAYRSDLRQLICSKNGQITASDICRQVVDPSPATDREGLAALCDAALASLACRYGTTEAAADNDDTDAFRYREWDDCLGDYRTDHVRLRERRTPRAAVTFYHQTLSTFQGLVGQTRYAFELLRPEEMTILRQWREGDDFDYRAMVDYIMDKKAGLMPSDRLFIKRIKRLRDVAALLLVDLSKSTANAVDRRGTRVLDVEKQAIVLLCEALQKVGDRFAIAGFSGTGPLGVDYYPVKALDEPLTDAVKGRIGAMAPQRNTRMGAAIRHATAQLSAVQARVKLIVLLGDGFPNDLAYKGAYAVEDTRRAILEARSQGTFVRAITVTAGNNKQLDRLYGAAHHTRIGNIQDLPNRLVRVYSALTRH